jgi:hypothetical protein
MTDDPDLLNRIQDRNAAQMDFAAKALGQAGRLSGIVGGRPDGTMEHAQGNNRLALEPLLNQIMGHDANLRNEISQLKAQLATEREARERLQNIIRQVADLIVNGSRGDA